MKKSLLIIIIMSLSILLSTSSFSFQDYFSALSSPDDRLFDYAYQQQHTRAIRQKRSRQPHDSAAWLMYTRTLAQTDPTEALALAEYYQHKPDSLSELANVDAIRQASKWYQHALALVTSQYWLQRHLPQRQYTAFKQRLYLRAASFYVSQNQSTSAFELLLEIADVNQSALLMAFDLATGLGRADELSQYQHLLELSDKGKAYHALLERYQVFNLWYQTLPEQVISSSKLAQVNHVLCSNSIQFLSATLAGLQHAEQLIEQFQSHPLAEQVCFETPRYLPPKYFDCQAKQGSAISCNLLALSEITPNIKSRYLAFVHSGGGANVHYGSLHLALDDNTQVFAHELSHLLGFGDEYQLRAGHKLCRPEHTQQSQVYNLVTWPVDELVVSSRASELTSANFSIAERRQQRIGILAKLPWGELIDDNTPIWQQIGNRWYLGTPDTYRGKVGLFRSESCDANPDVQAFKPIYDFNQLRFFELDFPQAYLKIKALQPSKYLMPSFHYNLALESFWQNDIEQAKGWLGRAAQLELDDKRKAKVLAGDY